MDTEAFLSHILPSQGYLFVIYVDADKPKWNHVPAESAQEAANLVLKYRGRKAVYHACASYREPEVLSATEKYRNGQPKKTQREHTNALFVKSLWVDLDCGPTKEYPDQKAAIADVVRFCKETGMPRPLFVNSGNGVHCYWVFDQNVTAEQWKRIANMWRCVLDHFNLKHDSNCTTDIARVLRPVGSFNRKGEPREVKVIGSVPPVVSVQDMVGRLVRLAKANNIKITSTQTAKAKPMADNSDLGGGMDYPPSSAYQIAQHCAQVGVFRDTLGNVEEPLWYAMLGLLKHTVENDAICHEWSAGHPSYDFNDTQNKINQWVHGPTTCSKLSALNSKGCDGCPHSKKVSSPIQLGTIVPESKQIVEEDNSTGEVEELPKIPRHMAEKFVWTGNNLCIFTRTEDGVIEHVPFSAMYLYPKQYSRNVANKMDMTWVLRERPGRYREFELPGEVIGVGGRDLSAKLGQQGVVCSPGGKKAMEQYITEWFNVMRGTVDEVAAYTTFGWHKEGFLLGDTLFKADGSHMRVRVQGDAERYAEAFQPKGSLQEWIDKVDALYNRPNHEQFQWMMATGFGAPLVKLLGGIAGCIINGYSSETGLGKSTAGMVGLGMYGDPHKLMLAKNQATTKGLFAYVGMMNSLPVLLDEVTNTKGYEFSDLAYTFSNATGRVGAQSDGSLRANVYGWNTLLQCTSNRAIQPTIAASKVDATPEIARVFEYKFVRPTGTMTKLDADDLIPSLMANCGHAGRVFIQYVVQNQEDVRTLLSKTRRIISKKGNVGQQERFWLAGMTVIITGVLIAKKLGLVKFDVAALLDWALRQVRSMRDLVGETETNVLDQFGVMLNELSNGFLVTDKEGDARANEARALVLHSPRGELVGRVVASSNTLYLPVSVVRKWCSENQADYREMTNALVAMQWASVEPKSISLGKGTHDYATAPSRCYKIDLAQAGGQLSAAAQVVQLRTA